MLCSVHHTHINTHNNDIFLWTMRCVLCNYTMTNGRMMWRRIQTVSFGITGCEIWKTAKHETNITEQMCLVCWAAYTCTKLPVDRQATLMQHFKIPTHLSFFLHPCLCFMFCVAITTDTKEHRLGGRTTTTVKAVPDTMKPVSASFELRRSLPLSFSRLTNRLTSFLPNSITNVPMILIFFSQNVLSSPAMQQIRRLGVKSVDLANRPHRRCIWTKVEWILPSKWQRKGRSF